MMAPLRRTPPGAFSKGVDVEDLELRGIRARAFHFARGCRDTDRALVCLAGMGANGRSFARQRPLADRWLVLPLNTPVETPQSTDPLSFAVETVEEYLDHEELRRPVLLGSSFGATVATLVALRRPEKLRALVLVGGVLSRRQIPLAFPGFINVLEAPDPLARLVAPIGVEIMGGFALDRDARDEIVREARHFSGTELKRRLRELMAIDLLPRLRELRLPTLVIHGSRDWLVPWRRGRWTAENLPLAHFELIRGAGHLPYLSHPEPFNAMVDAFLSGLREERSDAAAERLDGP